MDVAAGRVAILAQQADAIVGVDRHHRRTAGMAHDLERQPHAIGQLDRVDTHLDDAPVEDHFRSNNIAASVPARNALLDREPRHALVPESVQRFGYACVECSETAEADQPSCFASCSRLRAAAAATVSACTRRDARAHNRRHSRRLRLAAQIEIKKASHSGRYTGVTAVTARREIEPVFARLSYIVVLMSTAEKLGSLNAPQRKAVTYGEPLPGGKGFRAGPLLIVAGAGTGKTNTLAHRVAHLAMSGVDPARILMLTFTRRAAVEMKRRAQRDHARSVR